MNVQQIYPLVNEATKSVLGEQIILNEDLSNIVDVGEAIFNAEAVDNYVKKLVNEVGKVVFVSRKYEGSAPSVYMDSWEFGSVMLKISSKLPEATENEDWSLKNNTPVDPNVFIAPDVEVKFFNGKVTFEIDRSILDIQVKESFTSVEQLNAFVSMIFTEIENSLTIKTDALVMRTINSMTADTLKADYDTADYSAKSGIKAVNLLYLYNQTVAEEEQLTVANCITNTDFCKFASMIMGNYIDRLKVMSTLFNIGGEARFTSRDRLHCVLLSDFKNACNSYLQADTFHKEYTALPEAETVPYWQGSGTDYAFNSVSAIDVTSGSGNTVKTSGILGVMFDRYALGVCNMNKRVRTQYNSKGEFTNYFWKEDAHYFTDGNENYVVFFVA